MPQIAQQLLAQVRFRELNTAAAQPLHEPREWNVTRIQKQMHMVQHQNIGTDAKSIRFFQTTE